MARQFRDTGGRLHQFGSLPIRNYFGSASCSIMIHRFNIGGAKLTERPDIAPSNRKAPSRTRSRKLFRPAILSMGASWLLNAFLPIPITSEDVASKAQEDVAGKHGSQH